MASCYLVNDFLYLKYIMIAIIQAQMIVNIPVSLTYKFLSVPLVIRPNTDWS